MQNPTSDCSELLRKTAGTLSDDTILQLFLTVQKNNLALSIELAIIRWLLHVSYYEAKLLIMQSNRVTFPDWKLFKRKREWREMVEEIVHYFPHLVCETYLTMKLYSEIIYSKRVRQHSAGLN